MDDYNRIEPATNHPNPEPGVNGSAQDQDTGGGGGKPAPTRSSRLPAALAYAERGIPVFPLVPRGKKPIIPKCRNARGLSGEALARHARGCHMGHGLYDATTDEGRIREWWNRWPDANIGVPTGERSGLSALDVDSYKPGAWGPDDIAAQLGPIPATLTALSGRGGGQFVYLHPPGAVRNGVPEDELGPGVGIKADGGYIVVAPSVTVGPYEWTDSRPPAEAPDWFVAALTRQPRAAGGASGDGSGGPVPPSVDRGGPPIPDGTRNDTLPQIAGRLHDGTRTVGQLEADLAAINAARCEPPLPGAVVRTMARNIHARPPCRAAPTVTAEVRDALAEIEAELWRMDAAGMFPGTGGKSERDALIALIVAGREIGTRIPAGVRVSIGLRLLARDAAVSKRSMLDYRRNGERRPGVVNRLKRRGLIRSDNAGRDDGAAGAYVLVMPSEPTRARFPHSSTGEGLGGGGETLRAPRLRHSRPRFDRVGDEIIRSTVIRLGKSRGAVIDHLQRAGGPMAESALCAAVGIARPRDLRRRILPRLIAGRVVECSGDTVSLTPGWMAALEREREIALEIADDLRDAARNAREGDGYQEYLRRRRESRRAESPATPARPGPPVRRPAAPAADGVIGELERLPMGETPAAPAQSAPSASTAPPPRPSGSEAPETPLPRPDPAQATAPVEGRDGPPPMPPWAGRLRDWMALYPYRAGVYGVGAGYANYLYRTLWAYWPVDDPAPPPAPDAVAAAIAAIRSRGDEAA